jgi:hypothetical protein
VEPFEWKTPRSTVLDLLLVLATALAAGGCEAYLYAGTLPRHPLDPGFLAAAVFGGWIAWFSVKRI